MDRCALFVDAGYVLTDGAMAVHGTRRGESVSWDYEGLLQLLSSLAWERSGLPLLRCYWYEATVDGRRTAEQDALADVPGIKLRVAKIRPGRREGVEAEIQRDLSTLARNHAICDALLVSAEEDLAQVIADVQDLGMRVTLVHIAVDGNWTISRALRQESDDIIEISGDHLRPYVELIAGAEPVRADEEGQFAAALPLANGHSPTVRASYQQAPATSGNHALPSYAAPAVAEYQPPAQQLPGTAAREARETRDASDGRDAQEDRTREDRPREDWAHDDWAREDRTAAPAINGEAPSATRPDIYDGQDIPAPQENPARQDLYATPVTSTWSRPDGQAPASHRQVPASHRQEPAPQSPATRARTAEETAGYAQAPEPGPVSSGLAGAPAAETVQAAPGQLRRLPSSHNTANQSQPDPMSSGMHGGQGQGPVHGGPYTGPQPVLSSAAPAYQNGHSPGGPGGASLTDAVQAAHEEGQEFGGSVASDAPALWLEAVLARKPRMPSDLEARLLQGSALPIDFLLHDEVRHALRRGFWDALERTRR